MYFVFGVFSFVGFCFLMSYGMKAIPERIILEYANEKYVTDYKLTVRRYGRKSAYYVNMESTLKHTWGNNISFNVILYERLNNEYKRTFVEFHFNRLCDFVFNDPYIGKAVLKAMTGAHFSCPIQKGHVVLSNLSLAVDAFPYVWPFERFRADGAITVGNETIGNGSLYIQMKQ